MLVKNVNVITFGKPNKILNHQNVWIDKGKINKITDQSEVIEDKDVLEGKNRYLMPGNICAHTHYYGAFSRGMPIPGDPPTVFPEILEKLWWKLDKSLNLEEVYYSALICLIDAIRHGTTALIDHHASPNAIPGSLDRIANAVIQSGLRGVLCYEVTDRDGAEKAQEGIQENLRFIQQAQQNSYFDNHISAQFGLHASMTLSDQTLQMCREKKPDGVGFHIHAAEHVSDQTDSLNKSGKRVIERLHQHGILGSKTIVAHGVHINSNEMDLLAETKTWVTHQPRSNMNNAVGVSSVETMLERGIRVGMGNDGFSNAMWEEWKTAYLIHKLWNQDPRRMGADKVVEIAVYNNAALFNSFFDDLRIGVIEEGADADLIIVDYQPVTELTPENIPWQIIFGFRDSMVKTTIVGGKLLMNEGELLTIDEGKVSAQAKKVSKEVWGKYLNQF
jgi:putative selenium metabolism protein SsnA